MENRSGHAVHFLQRLERVSGQSAELALQFYHDPELLRAVLTNVRIPPQFDRIAVSLHEENRGPFLVASREGTFITCLARDMKVQNLHLLPNAQLLAHVQKTYENRHCLALAESLVGKENWTDKLIKRILKKGDDVTREEIIALSAVQPAIKYLLISAMFETLASANSLTTDLIRKKKLKSKEEKCLRRYWETYRAAGHFAVLAAMTGTRGIEQAVKALPDRFLETLSVLLFSGNMSMLFRLVWFIGKMGPVFLPHCKRLMFEPTLAEHWVLGFFGAAIIGLRHKKAKSQVLDALRKSLLSVNNFPLHVMRIIVTAGDKPHAVMMSTFCALTNPDMCHTEYLRSCRTDFFNEIAASGVELPEKYQWQCAENIPEDLALAFGAKLDRSFLTEPSFLLFFGLMIPWLARCEAEDFYYPHDFYQHIREPWQLEDAASLIEDDRKAHGRRTPTVAAPTPGRNDPCSCGSGKKFKKCCLLT